MPFSNQFRRQSQAEDLYSYSALLRQGKVTPVLKVSRHKDVSTLSIYHIMKMCGGVEV